MKNYKVIAMTGYDEQDKKNVSSKDAFVLDYGDGDFALVVPSIGHVKMSFTPDSFFKWDDFIDISDNDIPNDVRSAIDNTLKYPKEFFDVRPFGKKK